MVGGALRRSPSLFIVNPRDRSVLAEVLFLALVMVVGFGPVSRLDGLYSEARGCLSFVLGILVVGPAVYIVALVNEGLAPGMSFLTVSVLALISLRFSRWTKDAPSYPLSYRASLFVVLAPLYIISSRVFLSQGPGGLHSIHPVWGDLPIHLAFITSIAYGANLPPVYPIMPSVPAHYPFMIDFVSAVLVNLGASLRSAVLLPNILLYACLATLVYALVREALGENSAADLAAPVVFFAGGLQFLHAIMFKTFSDGELGQAGYHLHNTTWAFLLPQRTTLIGLSVFSAILLLLVRGISLNRHNRRRHFALAGLMAGLLPLFHAHSFLSVSVVAGGIALFHVRDRSGIEDALLFVLPIILLATPQVVSMSGQFSREGFIRQQWWWMVDEGATTKDVIWFWCKNLGVILLTYLIGLYRLPRKALILVVATAPLLLIPNVVVLQPWEWDNSKLVLCWLIGSLPAICAGAVRPMRWSPLGGLLLIPLFASSVLFLTPMFGGTSLLFSDDAIAVAEWVRDNTPPDAVFCADAGFKGQIHHNNAITSLAGRRTFIGYNGWLSSHGLDYDQEWLDTKHMLEGDCDVLNRYEVDYAYLRPQDGTPAPVFDEVHQRNGYRVFAVLCPSTTIPGNP